MNFTIMMSLGVLCGGCDILYNLIVKDTYSTCRRLSHCDITSEYSALKVIFSK